MAHSIFIACNEACVSLWDQKNNNILEKFSIPGKITDVSCATNGKTLAATILNGAELYLLDLGKRACLSPSILPNPATCLAFVPKQNERVVLGHANGTVCVWDFAKNKILQNFNNTHREPVHRVQSNSTSVACGYLKGNIAIFGHQTGQQLTQLACPAGDNAALQDLCFGHVKTSRLGAVYDTGTVALWDLNGARQPLLCFNHKNGGHQAPATSLAFSRTSAKLLLSVSLDKRLIGYDIADKKIVLDRAFPDPLTCVDTSEDGYSVLIGTTKGHIFNMDLRKNSVVEYKNTDSTTLRKVCFPSDSGVARPATLGSKLKSASSSSLSRVPKPAAKSANPVPASAPEKLPKPNDSVREVGSKATSRVPRPPSRNRTPTDISEPASSDPRPSRRSLSQGDVPRQKDQSSDCAATFLPIEKAAANSQVPVKAIPAPSARNLGFQWAKTISRSPSPPSLISKPNANGDLNPSNRSAFAVVPSVSSKLPSLSNPQPSTSRPSVSHASTTNINEDSGVDRVCSPVKFPPADGPSKNDSKSRNIDQSRLSIDSLYSPLRESFGSRPRETALFTDPDLNFSLGAFSPVGRSSGHIVGASSDSWSRSAANASGLDLESHVSRPSVHEQDNGTRDFKPELDASATTGFQPFMPHLMPLKDANRSSEETSPSLLTNGTGLERNFEGRDVQTADSEATRNGELITSQDLADLRKEVQELRLEMRALAVETRDSVRSSHDSVRDLLHKVVFDVALVRSIMETEFADAAERMTRGFDLVSLVELLSEQVNRLRSLY